MSFQTCDYNTNIIFGFALRPNINLENLFMSNIHFSPNSQKLPDYALNHPTNSPFEKHNIRFRIEGKYLTDFTDKGIERFIEKNFNDKTGFLFGWGGTDLEFKEVKAFIQQVAANADKLQGVTFDLADPELGLLDNDDIGVKDIQHSFNLTLDKAPGKSASEVAFVDATDAKYDFKEATKAEKSAHGKYQKAHKAHKSVVKEYEKAKKARDKIAKRIGGSAVQKLAEMDNRLAQIKEEKSALEQEIKEAKLRSTNADMLPSRLKSKIEAAEKQLSEASPEDKDAISKELDTLKAQYREARSLKYEIRGMEDELKALNDESKGIHKELNKNHGFWSFLGGGSDLKDLREANRKMEQAKVRMDNSEEALNEVKADWQHAVERRQAVESGKSLAELDAAEKPAQEAPEPPPTADGPEAPATPPAADGPETPATPPAAEGPETPATPSAADGPDAPAPPQGPAAVDNPPAAAAPDLALEQTVQQLLSADLSTQIEMLNNIPPEKRMDFLRINHDYILAGNDNNPLSLTAEDHATLKGLQPQSTALLKVAFSTWGKGAWDSYMQMLSEQGKDDQKAGLESLLDAPNFVPTLEASDPLPQGVAPSAPPAAEPEAPATPPATPAAPAVDAAPPAAPPTPPPASETIVPGPQPANPGVQSAPMPPPPPRPAQPNEAPPVPPATPDAPPAAPPATPPAADADLRPPANLPAEPATPPVASAAEPPKVNNAPAPAANLSIEALVALEPDEQYNRFHELSESDQQALFAQLPPNGKTDLLFELIRRNTLQADGRAKLMANMSADEKEVAKQILTNTLAQPEFTDASMRSAAETLLTELGAAPAVAPAQPTPAPAGDLDVDAFLNLTPDEQIPQFLNLSLAQKQTVFNASPPDYKAEQLLALAVRTNDVQSRQALIAGLDANTKAQVSQVLQEAQASLANVPNVEPLTTGIAQVLSELGAASNAPAPATPPAAGEPSLDNIDLVGPTQPGTPPPTHAQGTPPKLEMKAQLDEIAALAKNKTYMGYGGVANPGKILELAEQVWNNGTQANRQAMAKLLVDEGLSKQLAGILSHSSVNNQDVATILTDSKFPLEKYMNTIDDSKSTIMLMALTDAFGNGNQAAAGAIEKTITAYMDGIDREGPIKKMKNDAVARGVWDKLPESLRKQADKMFNSWWN